MTAKEIRKILRGTRGNFEVEFYCNGKKYKNISIIKSADSNIGLTSIQFHLNEEMPNDRIYIY